MRALAFPTFAAAFVIALALRWPIASHDVEHYVGPDEGEVVENVLEMVKTGDFDHRHRGYPGLHFYLQMIPVHVRLALTGKSVAELERADFYRAARRVTLAAGLLAGAAAFAIGLRLVGPWSAVVAGSLVLFSPLGFRESAVVNPDLLLSLFATAAVLASLRLLEDRSVSSFLLAGASVGLAAAIKYTGGFVVASFLLASLLGEERGRRFRKTAAGLAAAGVAFAATSPYTLVHLAEFVRGLETHVAYYQASETSALVELVKATLDRGLGLLGGLAAFAGCALAVLRRERGRLVVLAFPLLYVLVFALFERAFPRHALPILPSLAFFAADACARLPRRRFSAALSLVVLVGPLAGTVELWRRARRATPAERAAEWAHRELPSGSRVLADQFTPRLDPARFTVHRLQVEERAFAGNFDWVFYSGYPPGLETEGLREAVRFETDGALGDPVVVFQVPIRESLMEVTLGEREESVELGAGELPFFGEGWEAPRPGAFGTERLSRGAASEIFFVLGGSSSTLLFELTLSCAVCPAAVALELNGREIGRIELESPEPSGSSIAVTPEVAAVGLNRLRLAYPSPGRLDRRHREASVRFYRMRITRSRE